MLTYNNRLDVSFKNTMDIHAFYQYLSGPNGPVDFDYIIRSPDILSHLNERKYVTFVVDGQHVVHANSYKRRDELSGVIEERPFTAEEAAEFDSQPYQTHAEWAATFWGSESNAIHAKVHHKKDTGTIRFVTRGGPPRGIVRALRRVFCEVEIEAFYDNPQRFISGYY
ncbi:hypothetical protein [Limimaricola cinnabarinus]